MTQRSELAHLDPRNVDALVPLVERYKRRGFTAAACGSAISRDWGRQAKSDLAHGMLGPIVGQNLKAALAALADIIHAVYGTRILFQLNGEVQS